MPDKENFNAVADYETTKVVRRSTPDECTRLQGFPDGWLLIGEPDEVEYEDFVTECDEDGEIVRKEKIGEHTETVYKYTNADGKEKKVTDSDMYKALGNSICLPFWQTVARRISAQYDRDITMGSLFDGIGGFPLVFARVGADPVWNSEIEPFCEEVTKRRFGDGEHDHGDWYKFR